MDEDAKRATTLELGSRYLARKGLAAVTDLQAQVDRARNCSPAARSSRTWRVLRRWRRPTSGS